MMKLMSGYSHAGSSMSRTSKALSDNGSTAGALVEVGVADSELEALLVEREHHRVVGFPAPRLAAPFGRVPLETAHAQVGDLMLDLLDGVRRPGIDPAEGDQPIGGPLDQLGVALRVDETRVVEVHEHLGGEDRHVGRSLDEHVLQVPVGVDLPELLVVVHRPLGIGGLNPLWKA